MHPRPIPTQTASHGTGERGTGVLSLRKRGRAASLALVGVFALLVSACGTSTSAPAKSHPAPATFAVSEDLFGQAIVANARGYFAGHGIKATVTNYSTGVATLEAALTGRADFAAALAFPTLTYLKSHALVIVAADMHPAPGFYSLALRSNIAYPHQLDKATWGLETGTDQVYQTSALLKAYGFSFSKAKTVSFSDQFGEISALRAGEISAALVYEQGIAQAKAIPGVSIYPDELKSAIEPAYIVVSRNYLAHNEGVVVRALQALREANAWMLPNMQQAAKIVGKFVGAPPSSLYSSMKGEDYTVSWSSSDLSAFKSISKVLLEQHLTNTLPSTATNINTAAIDAATKS